MKKLKAFIKKYHLWVMAVVLCIPILCYIINFASYGVSGNVSDWAAFGDYIGGVYSVVLTIVLVYVSYSLNKKSEKEKEKLRAIHEIYSSIVVIKSEEMNIDDINGLVRLIISNQLYIRANVFNHLISFTDYCKTVIVNRSAIDIERETSIKNMLID